MTCYKDMTFCPFEDCINFGPCMRSYTEFVREAAEEWWGDVDAPVCLYTERPPCYFDLDIL